jgi:hypothetical protein
MKIIITKFNKGGKWYHSNLNISNFLHEYFVLYFIQIKLHHHIKMKDHFPTIKKKKIII